VKSVISHLRPLLPQLICLNSAALYTRAPNAKPVTATLNPTIDIACLPLKPRRSAESAVRMTIGGMDVPVVYAGAQLTFPGLDQINVQLPRTLAGKGEVDLAVTVDGESANTTRLSFK
jgi:uncharacterized protein (TIGR03437 family)